MPRLPYSLLFAAWLAVMLAPTTQAQTRFKSCFPNNPEDNATVIIPEAVLSDMAGEPIADGDEVAVFTPDGKCAGVAVWNGNAQALSIQGDNSLTPEKDGFNAGEELYFRVWDVSKQIVHGKGTDRLSVHYDDSSPLYRSDGRYQSDAIYVVSNIGTNAGATAAEDEAGVPVTFALNQNYPNPFNPATTIEYGLARPQSVRLAVYNALGQEVRVLVDGTQPQGRHTASFDAADLPSGLYFYQLKAEEGMLTKQMMLVK
jgi:hypothetical protein